MAEDCTLVDSEIELRDDGEARVSRSVQTSTEDTNVLITVRKDELMTRIKAFMEFKRKQINLSNQLEYIRQPCSGGSTCARVDAVFVGGAKHTKSSEVVNTEGPNAHLPTLRDRLWAELVLEGRVYERPEVTGNHVLMLNERLTELEDIISDNQDTSEVCLLERIRCLEARVANLEGTSKEYNNNNNILSQQQQ